MLKVGISVLCSFIDSIMSFKELISVFSLFEQWLIGVLFLLFLFFIFIFSNVNFGSILTHVPQMRRQIGRWFGNVRKLIEWLR